MIIEVGFLDHWKTRALIDALGDETAPLCLIRFWAHCQSRKRSQFENLSAAAIKAICHYTGDASKLERDLIESGWLRRDGNVVTAIGWDEYNAGLIANWENGKRGGRPPRNPPPETQSAAARNKPMGNPPETHGLPMDNPPGNRLDGIGLDGIGDEEKREDKDKEGRAPSRAASAGESADSCFDSKPTSAKRAATAAKQPAPIPAGLQELANAWNALPEGSCPRVVKLDAKEILKGWKRVQADADIRACFADVDELMAAITRSLGFLGGQGFFNFLWLFKKDYQDRVTWNVTKILAGNFKDDKRNRSSSTRSIEHGPSQQFDESVYHDD